MAIRLGKIPLRESVNELERAYGEAQKEMIGILSDIDVSDFGEVSAMRIRQRIDVLIRGLNRTATRWAVKSIRRAYRDSARQTEISLLGLGAKKRKMAENRERAVIAKYADRVMETLYRANGSIRLGLESYLEMNRRASFRLNQVSHFRLKPRILEFIDDIVEKALRVGESMQKTARIIRDRLVGEIQRGQIIRVGNRNYTARYYAQMVARTEMRYAQSEAVKNKCAEYENDLVEVSNHGTVCPKCKPFEGKVYSLSGKSFRYPKLPNEPPWHPNCLLPGNRLIAPGGFVAGIRAQYNGEAIELSFAEAGNLTVTKNHLFLTPYGFAPAYLLRQGDDVFYCPGFERIITIYPYNNGTPSLIEDIIHALSISSGMATGGVPVSPEYIHGDGRFCDGDIDIIRPNGFLGDTGKSLFFKHGEALALNSRDAEPALFPGERDLAAMLRALALSADSIMGGLRAAASFFLCRPGGDDSMALANATDREPLHDEPLSYGRPGYPELFSNLMKKHPGLISTIKIMGINTYSFHGYVYDLHTSTSLYLANGLLSSNCEHHISPTSEVALEFREKYG